MQVTGVQRRRVKWADDLEPSSIISLPISQQKRSYNLTYWEVFNEAEHSYTVERYTHDYDVLVSAVRQLADTNKNIKWMGIGCV